MYRLTIAQEYVGERQPDEPALVPSATVSGQLEPSDSEDQGVREDERAPRDNGNCRTTDKDKTLCVMG